MNDIDTKTYDNDKILQLLPAPEGMFFAYEDDGKARPVSCLALVELSNGDREVKAMGLMNCGQFEEITGAALFHEFPQTANQQTAGDKFLQIIPAPAGTRYRFPEDGEKVHPAACLALVEDGEDGTRHIHACGQVSAKVNDEYGESVVTSIEDVEALGAEVFF